MNEKLLIVISCYFPLVINQKALKYAILIPNLIARK